MGKTIILTLSNVILEGDILDVGESYGVIYNLSKEAFDELAIDYIEDDNKEILLSEGYDTCTIFFYLSNIWREGGKAKLIDDVTRFVKKGGSVYIWDINKDIGKVFNNKIRAVLPSKNVKEFDFKNLNIMSKSNLEDTKKLLESNYKITEEKIWEDIYFVKGEKL